MHGAKKNKAAKVILDVSEYGTVENMIGSMRLVSGVGARSLRTRAEIKTKCVGKRYAQLIAFEKGENATGVWHLQGSFENHKRYNEAAQNNPKATHREVMAIINSTFHENCKLLYPKPSLDCSRKWLT